MANAAIFESKYDQAIEILQAIIKDCPTAHEPYQTLAMVYEEKGDNNKSLMFLMVAAHLKPKDIELWKRVACLSKDLNSLSQAIYCYNKVISLDSEDQDAWWERCALLIETNQLRKVFLSFINRQ